MKKIKINDEWVKNIIYNSDLKFKNKIGLKINVKIKFGQILRCTIGYSYVIIEGILSCLFLYIFFKSIS